MRVEARRDAVVIVLDDGSEHVVAGASVPGFVDYGRTNTYGTELRAQWGGAELHRRDGTLHLCVSECFEGCGNVSRSFRGFWRSDDGGRTWARDPRPPWLSADSLLASVTTRP